MASAGSLDIYPAAVGSVKDQPELELSGSRSVEELGRLHGSVPLGKITTIASISNLNFPNLAQLGLARITASLAVD